MLLVNVYSQFVTLCHFLPILNNYTFTQLNISPHKNESIDSFNKKKQAIYINSDVYMGLSLQEGYSYSLVDALLCGLPILSTNVGLFYSDVPDNAFVRIDLELRDNPDYIKEKLEYAVSNKESLGKNARAWYLANCAFSNWKLNMHNIVRNIYDYVYVDTSSNI
jgi:glycosyltransferase involved in cell wall biosynthesis